MNGKAGQTDHQSAQPLRLVLSIDVEEEGLFSHSYPCRPTVDNVAHMTRLVPLMRDCGARLTLFCAHSVFTNAAACKTIAQLRDTYNAEVGAHLHHWSTPPLKGGEGLSVPQGASYQGSGSVNTALVPVPLLADKLEALFTAGALFQGAALTSFRMGRWDLRREHWPLLAQAGVLADASVRPLHCGQRLPAGHGSAPDHFSAPREPYTVRVGEHEIFECPLTTTPLFPPALSASLAPLLTRLPWAETMRASLQKWGALTLLPAYQPLWLMQLGTLAHIRAGGHTLSLTWHSSEMMPGGAPHLPTEAAVQKFMLKMDAYVQWLHRHWRVEALTLSQLREKMLSEMSAPAPAPQMSTVDWMYS